MAPDQAAPPRRRGPGGPLGARSASPDAGFTLVEMLVSLTLLAMAATMMATGFAAGHRLWASAERRTQDGESVEAAQTLLREGIERLRPATRAKGSRFYSDVDGDTRQFTFIAVPPDAQRPAAMRRYRVSLNDAGDLVLAWAPDDGAGQGAFTDQVLLRRVDGLEIGYFGPPRPNDPPQWQETWSRQATPPELVRIRVIFGPADRRTWPDLIVRPAATVDTSCLIDADTGKCGGRT